MKLFCLTAVLGAALVAGVTAVWIKQGWVGKQLACPVGGCATATETPTQTMAHRLP